MDTAPVDPPTGEPAWARPAESPSIGVPSIPARSDEDPSPVPVPSIDVPDEFEPVSVPSAPTPPIGGFEGRPVDAPRAPGPPAEDGAIKDDEYGAGGEDGADGEDGEDGESFTPAVRSRLRSYVYLLVDPRTGRPFFAGCGRDERCFDHVRAARRGIGLAPPPVGSPAPSATDAGTGESDEFPALDRIRQVEGSGRRVRVEILRYGLEPDVAATVGAAACDLLGSQVDPPVDSQRRPAAEVALLLTKRAKFKRAHQVVLLPVGPTGTEASYERVRHGWRIGRRWVDVTAPRSPHWAVVVVGELVDSVYRLDRWETHWETEDLGAPGSAPGGAGARRGERYSFVGTRDAELESRYVGKSAAPYLRNGPPGSVAYVWSGPHWVNAAR